MIASIKTVVESLKRDAARYEGGWYKSPGFWVGATYRFGVWARAVRNRPLRAALLVNQKAIDVCWRALLNVHVSAGARIGPGLCLLHARDIRIGPAEIGANCLVFHEVTIGSNARSGRFPRIGDNVDIYVGARVLGNLAVGDDAKIGANCVVTGNVKPGHVVVNAANRVVPARIVAAFGPRRAAEAVRAEAPDPRFAVDATRR